MYSVTEHSLVFFRRVANIFAFGLFMFSFLTVRRMGKGEVQIGMSLPSVNYNACLNTGKKHYKKRNVSCPRNHIGKLTVCVPAI